MKLKNKILSVALAGIYALSHAQMGNYAYKRELKDINGSWHKIVLPDDIFQKASPYLDDIRIYGITKENDTIEAPYILKLKTDQILKQDIDFKLTNISHNDNGYFYTFVLPKGIEANEITLDFKQANFDWNLRLEGSEDLEEWYTILDNYRILSIKNEITDFRFSTLAFPTSTYKYYRVRIESHEKPQLLSAKVSLFARKEGTYRRYHSDISITENKSVQTSEIYVDLAIPVPVSYIRIFAKSEFDYYRAVSIQRLASTLRNEKGPIDRYENILDDVLNSRGADEFKFNTANTQRLKITVYNKDNAPLTIDSVHVMGYTHELFVRFSEKAHYFLVYGNKNATKPQYDIERFQDTFPPKMPLLSLGEETEWAKKETAITPLFVNKVWLWSLMTVIILLLGWFTIKMLRSGNNNE